MALNYEMNMPEPSAKPESLILLIHNQPDIIEAYRTVLEAQGHRVEVATDGPSGINTIYRLIPDLIIADILLPEVNGYQICRLMKNDPAIRKVPFILVSSYDEKLDRFWGFKAGADAFIPHGDTDGKLAQQVEMLLQIYGRVEQDEKRRPNIARNEEDLFNIRTRLNQILDKSLIESTLMVEFRNLCDLIHDRNLLNYMLFSLLESILDFDAIGIFYNDKNRHPRVLTLHVPENTKMAQAGVEMIKDRFFEVIYEADPAAASDPQKYALLESEVIGDLQEEAPLPAFKTAYVKPFMNGSELIGAIAFYSNEAVDYQQIFPVNLIENEIKMLMKLRGHYSQAETLAITDGLTGLYNYRHFTTVLEREFRRAKRYEVDLAMAVIDIDGFKELNESWGHLMGDEVLRNLAAQARKCFREIDFIARYGGEELVVIFPETTAENALIACERFRQGLESHPVTWKDMNIETTVSIGLVGVADSMNDASALLRKLDEALAKAKANGGNRIEYLSE